MNEGTTHYAGCIQAGPKHYECALQEVRRLRETIMDLRVKLEAAKQETEIQKAKADKHYELGTEYFDLYTKALRGQLKEMEWVGLTADEATIIWERVDESDGWELIIQVQQALKEKNGG